MTTTVRDARDWLPAAKLKLYNPKMATATTITRTSTTAEPNSAMASTTTAMASPTRGFRPIHITLITTETTTVPGRP
ncbi:MAG: hypothetical protein R2788_13415 [Saprospiraceae bacterium]